MFTTIKNYYTLTKPGIIYGNAVTAIAGFFLASRGHFDLQTFLGMLVGLSLIIGSGCVFNNWFDVTIDAKMERTKNRPLVTGVISKKGAIIFGILLLILGTLDLFYLTTIPALIAAMIGFVVYVVLYTPLKHKTVNATLIGAIAGATPPVVGYVAVTNKFDIASLILFFILVFWQMPHFYAIAIYQLQDYAAASIPVLPIKKGIHTTKVHILLYILIFIFFALLLTVHKFTGYAFAAAVIILGLAWLRLALQGFRKSTIDATWARKVFLFSLITLTSLSVVMALNAWLP